MNLVSYFRDSKRIYGICPCCGEVFRLSDATLFTTERPPATPFDRVDAERAKLERAEERFEARQGQLRLEAVEKGQREARKHLRSIAGSFIERRIDPQDVKVIFDPVEFVAFRGMTRGRIDRIAFIDRPPSTRAREQLQRSIARAVKAGNVEWRTLRISNDGRVQCE